MKVAKYNGIGICALRAEEETYTLALVVVNATTAMISLDLVDVLKYAGLGHYLDVEQLAHCPLNDGSCKQAAKRMSIVRGMRRTICAIFLMAHCIGCLGRRRRIF